MHILGAIVAVLAALDLTFGVVRLCRAMRRQRAVSPSGALVLESAPLYISRILRAILPPLLILAVLVLGFLAIVHFGPLKPIHEW
jgi:hypothetical protein